MRIVRSWKPTCPDKKQHRMKKVLAMRFPTVVDLHRFNPCMTSTKVISRRSEHKEGTAMSYFGTIYADTELPSRARAVYMYLRDRSNKKGECWPGIKTIAKELHLSRSTVKRALADLEKSGYLQKVARHRENGSNTVSTQRDSVLVFRISK